MNVHQPTQRLPHELSRNNKHSTINKEDRSNSATSAKNYYVRWKRGGWAARGWEVRANIALVEVINFDGVDFVSHLEVPNQACEKQHLLFHCELDVFGLWIEYIKSNLKFSQKTEVFNNHFVYLTKTMLLSLVLYQSNRQSLRLQSLVYCACLTWRHNLQTWESILSCELGTTTIYKQKYTIRFY